MKMQITSQNFTCITRHQTRIGHLEKSFKLLLTRGGGGRVRLTRRDPTWPSGEEKELTNWMERYGHKENLAGQSGHYYVIIFYKVFPVWVLLTCDNFGVKSVYGNLF